MISRRSLFAGALGLAPAGGMRTAGLTDADAADLLTQAKRTTLTQGWGLVHGSHFTGPQPGLDPAVDRWSIMSNVDRSEVRHLQAMRAIVERDAAVDLRRRLRAAVGQAATPLRIMCAGDSITVGVGSTGGDGYRGWLAAELDRLDYAPAGLDTVAGGSGLMLDDLATPIAAGLAAGPRIVLLAVGTNDSAWGNVGTFGARYAARLDSIHAAAPNAKIACAKISISHERADPVRANGGVPANQATINAAVAAAVAARPGWTALADMTKVAPDWLYDGGWHPGDGGYVLMAREWLRAITPWLP